MIDIFKEYTSGYELQYFWDWLFFHDQQDEFHIDKSYLVYVNNSITFWDCATDVFPQLAKLASRLIEMLGNSLPNKLLVLTKCKCTLLINKLREKTWLIQNLIFTKTRNGIKEINLNSLIYIYINKQILNWQIGKYTNRKLKYTNRLKIKEEEMIDLEKIMLQEKIGENEDGIDIEDGDTREKNKDRDVGDDIRMSETPFCQSKKAWLNWIIDVRDRLLDFKIHYHSKEYLLAFKICSIPASICLVTRIA